MRIKVTRKQFQLLVNNLHWIKGKALEMTNKVVQKVLKENPQPNK